MLSHRRVTPSVKFAARFGSGGERAITMRPPCLHKKQTGKQTAIRQFIQFPFVYFVFACTKLSHFCSYKLPHFCICTNRDDPNVTGAESRYIELFWPSTERLLNWRKPEKSSFLRKTKHQKCTSKLQRNKDGEDKQGTQTTNMKNLGLTFQDAQTRKMERASGG